ncbi:MAG: FtsX-like permease family protein [Propionibacteriaceae bacterium]|nr:FtsX-like permease family protein [Propionibacteriaceae bacterium]
MWLAAWRSLLGHKLRFGLSTLAITLAVAFVSGSLVFTNLLGAAFTNLTKGTLADVNVAVEGTYSDADPAPDAAEARLLPVNLSAIGGVAGVASVTGVIRAFNVFPVNREGRVIGSPGAPAIASNWFLAPGADGGRGIVLRSGREPAAADEAVVDPATLTASGHEVGSAMDFSTPQGTITKTVVGTAEWGDSGSVGATYVFLTTAEAQRLFLGGKDAFLAGWVVAEPGVDADVLAERVKAVLPQGFEAASARAASEAAGERINASLGFLSTFLLVFAGIAALVSSFLIVNTFNVIVAQRARELALLRAIGAKRRQVRLSVLAEAGVIGTFAATVGLFGGLGLAWLIRLVFSGMGFQLGSIAPTLTPAAVFASYLVGVVVTVVAAMSPAMRASRTPPVAAMSGALADSRAGRDWWGWAGLLACLVGAAALLFGGFGGFAQWWFVGIGAVVTLAGAVLAAPVLGRPVVAGLGAVFSRTHGEMGRLATRNVVRQPRRLAATVSAIMIGLALVTTVAVLGASAEATLRASVKDGLRGDLQVTSASGRPFGAKVGDEAGSLPGVAAVHRMKATMVQFTDPERQPLTLVGLAEASFDRVVAQTLVEGSLPTGDGEVIVSQHRSQQTGWGIGSSFGVTSGGGAATTLRVVGIFDNPDGVRLGGLIVSPGTFSAITPLDSDLIVSIDLGPDADAAAVRSGLEDLAAGDPTLVVTNQAEWEEAQVARLSTALGLLYGLLGLALVIAVLGVVNTLVLAVIERTREIGLLRAIGLTRPQLRRIITLEAVMVSLLGCVLGVGLGLLYGVVIRQAAAADGLSHLGIPWTQIGVFLVLTAVIGMLAAVWPARRASRLDILAAIATE